MGKDGADPTGRRPGTACEARPRGIGCSLGFVNARAEARIFSSGFCGKRRR